MALIPLIVVPLAAGIFAYFTMVFVGGNAAMGDAGRAMLLRRARWVAIVSVAAVLLAGLFVLWPQVDP